MQQFMKWNAIYFSANQIYEHDVFLFNGDGKTYLDSRSTSYPGCYPVNAYAVTNFPAAAKYYIDTRFSAKRIGCEITELAYTLGVAQANALKANVNYYTYMQMAAGNASTDHFKLQAQIGHRTPTSCYSTWCSFGDEYITIVPFPSGVTNVPGSLSWTRN